jgi:protein gp37
MGSNTDIEWCDSTVNPTTGCDGCELWHVRDKGPCYAGVLHESRLAKSLPKLYAPSFTEVRLAPGRMAKAAAWSDLRGKPRPDKPWLDGKPRMIFVDDMGDLFSKAVPFDYIDAEVLDTAQSAAGSKHLWMLLTKQPSRAATFGRWLADRGKAWPENVWLGTSVTSQKTADSRISHLLAIPAAVRFLSVEPLLGPVELEPWLSPAYVAEANPDGTGYDVPGLDWVIVGGESGPGARPCNLAWIRSIVAQCGAAGVPVFVKQLGSTPYTSHTAATHLPGDIYTLAKNDGGRVEHRGVTHPKGGNPAEWPEDLRVREFLAVNGGAA